MTTKQQLKILFVDDVRDSFLSWGRPLITKYKFGVDYADGVLAAKENFLKALEQDRYDAVVLDRYMPDPDRGGEYSVGTGDNLLEFFRLRAPETAVVMLSNETSVEDARRTNQRGAYSLLPKGESTVEEVYREICAGVATCRIETLCRKTVSEATDLPQLARLQDFVNAIALRSVGNQQSGPTSMDREPIITVGYATYGPGGSLLLRRQLKTISESTSQLVADEIQASTAVTSALDDTLIWDDLLQWIPIDEDLHQRMLEQKFLLLDASVVALVDWPHSMGGDADYQCLLPVEHHGSNRQAPYENELFGVLCFQTKSIPIKSDDILLLQRIGRAIGIAQSFWLFRDKAVAYDGNILAESLFEEYAHRIRSPLMTAQLAIDRMYDSRHCPPDFELGLSQVRQAIVDVTDNMRSLDVRESEGLYESRELTTCSLEKMFRSLFCRYESYQGRMFTLSAENEAFVHGSNRDLFYAFRCLLDNAIESVHKNPPEKPGKVQVSISTDPSEKRAVHVAILDNGGGFDHDVPLHTLFDRGVSTKTTGSGERRGLGLWEVKRIVEKHKGFVEALDAPKGGAYFSVILPVAEGAKND